MVVSWWIVACLCCGWSVEDFLWLVLSVLSSWAFAVTTGSACIVSHLHPIALVFIHNVLPCCSWPYLHKSSPVMTPYQCIMTQTSLCVWKVSSNMAARRACFVKWKLLRWRWSHPWSVAHRCLLQTLQRWTIAICSDEWGDIVMICQTIQIINFWNIICINTPIWQSSLPFV